MAKGPVLIELEGEVESTSDVNTAPTLPDPVASAAEGRAMQTAAKMMARKPSFLGRLFWSVTLMLLGAVISVAAWDFAAGLMLRWPILGLVISGLLGLFVLILLIMALREVAALGRLSRIDGLRHAASGALENNSLPAAKVVTARLTKLYKGREDTRWGRDRFAALSGDQMDGIGLLAVAETEIVHPLDEQAMREVEAAARQVATVTALVPLALADVATALTANLRMIRRIAEIYGGRSGLVGNWRLTRAVMTHLVATGAVAVGDDLLEPFLGGSVLGKLSRRFGEGLVNGALTARVGVAAIEVCRPLPFRTTKRPKAAQLVRRALGGLFQTSS
ncbi:YcjF family protein [Ascidiaceihabitans sp.]|jgi:putative membrane protein|nr:TIGR01620 family protein [Ascidiaceihabitans sp.]MDA9135655.1 YcjF family protein [Ascidiaceihabitans sp.]